MLYTDGLVERRGTSLDVGLRRLAASVMAGPVVSVCARVMAELVGHESLHNNFALLAVRLTRQR